MGRGRLLFLIVILTFSITTVVTIYASAQPNELTKYVRTATDIRSTQALSDGQQQDEPINYVLTTADVDACTEEQAEDWRFVRDSTLGVGGTDPVGHQIGSFSAEHWGPPDGFKHTLCGTLYKFNFYDPWHSGDEADWNNFIIPDPEFTHLITDLLPIMQFFRDRHTLQLYEQWHDCTDENGEGENNCLEAEITPDENFYNNPWFPRGPGDERAESPLEGTTICTYGPWVYDEGHGNRPEIHPSELYWWRETNNGPYFLMLLQDDSNRFDRPENYDVSGTGPVWWRPWSAVPRTGEFRVAFEVDPNDDPFIFDIRPLDSRNIVTEDDPEASQDSDDGKLHAIEYNGELVLLANERQPVDEELGVRFENVCLESDSSHLLGYLTLTSQVGKNDHGEEGYQVLRVDERQERVTRKRVTVTFLRASGATPPFVTQLIFEVNDEIRSIPLQSLDNAVSITFADFPSSESLRVKFGVAPWFSTNFTLGPAESTFTNETNFGEGQHTATITMSGCVPRPVDEDCTPVVQDLFEVSYQISVEDVFSLSPPPPLPDLVQPPVSVHAAFVPNSLLQIESGNQHQLVADIDIQTLGSPAAITSEFTVASVALDTAGELHTLPFSRLSPLEDPGGERRIRVSNVPIPLDDTDSQIRLRTVSGSVFNLTIPALSVYPLITNEELLTSPRSDTSNTLPTSALRRIPRWQFDVVPAYAPVRDGQTSLEDDSPIAEALNELLADGLIVEGKNGELMAVFGPDQPFEVGWSFNASNITTGEPVSVKLGGMAQPNEILVELSEGVVPDGHILVMFPKQPDGVFELVATARITDTFGTVEEVQHHIWSHVVSVGDSEEEVIDELLSTLPVLTAFPFTDLVNAASQLNEPVIDSQIEDDPRLRRTRLLYHIIIRAAEDKIITIDELHNIVHGTALANP